MDSINSSLDIGGLNIGSVNNPPENSRNNSPEICRLNMNSENSLLNMSRLNIESDYNSIDISRSISQEVQYNTSLVLSPVNDEFSGINNFLLFSHH